VLVGVARLGPPAPSHGIAVETGRGHDRVPYDIVTVEASGILRKFHSVTTLGKRNAGNPRSEPHEAEIRRQLAAWLDSLATGHCPSVYFQHDGSLPDAPDTRPRAPMPHAICHALPRRANKELGLCEGHAETPVEPGTWATLASPFCMPLNRSVVLRSGCARASLL
jgi:hypothetical protein